ncbi:unnamed protein product [Rotaria socialis]|uniref:MSP domain-containing protein n=3 Tax=Rotaria TaxID=231623 RepID=A0A818JHV0_9BILA|nr:unnamed protein product [Rotaria socialis]
MSLPTHLTSNASQLPFFCSSNSLLFYLDDPSTFSQVLTLYNPYDFVVRYKVLCTAPKKYSVAEPQGEIRAQHSVDTIVRLLDTSASSANQNVVHKIRVQFFDRRKSQDLIGKRDVTCSILSYKPLEQSFDDEPNMAGGTSKRTRPNTITNPTPPIIQQETRDPLVVFILTILGAICAFVLVLPTIPDSDNSFNARIPSYLHMTTNSKVIASYILGLLTNWTILIYFILFHGIKSKRLNKIIHDPIFTSNLNFVKWSANKFHNKLTSNFALNRFRLQILPDISIKVKWFYLEPSSAKSILRAADYPNLYVLGLYNINEKTARRLFTDERFSTGIFKKQITRLIITTPRKKNNSFTIVKICSCIFSICNKLTHLTFSESSYVDFVSLLFDVPSRSFSSSSLLALNIKVQHFSQLLYVLDGRFSQLHTLIVDLINNVLSTDLIENKEKILNLKCFVLSCAWEVTRYEECLLPLIYRMSNIEKLGLYLTIYVNDKFIDGNDLKKNVINRLPQLNLFTFDIRSLMFINNQINLPSKKDIEESFRDFQYTKIISYVDYFREKKTGQCHVFSYPSEMPYYQKITNNFPDGLYRYVRFISLYDEYPFEHEFFIKISQSIPFMERLSLINHQSQIHKQSYKLINHNFNSTIAKYNYLITLDIEEIHDDYIEEFLFNTKTYFHNNIVISINYKSLERVTRNFTRDVTRINCAKINEIFLSGEKRYFNSLRDYFPCARIH